jgi:DHA1 family multidrug resistance protein-like MFS transporter
MTRRSHPTLGEVVTADQVATTEVRPRRVRNIILLLAASVALMMTGFAIIMPIFARRFGELGGGVQALGLMTMAFALAQLVAAPFMGSAADRFGRRPIVLLSLAAFAVANVGFLLASSTTVFIVIRALEGGLTAGLFPAAMGVVADIAREDERGRWIGIVMGSYGAGFILGPIVGGVLYDGWGFAAPFIASAVMAAIAFIAAAVLVPETRTSELRKREMLEQRREAEMALAPEKSLWSSVPRPLTVFATLLIVDFMIYFAWAFVEPQLVFYLYDELAWTTVQFGAVVAVYGLALVVGQATLGQLSDRFDRRLIIILGTLINSTFYVGLALTSWFPVALFVALLSGVGEALVLPAVSAYVLDITAEQHRSRIMGIKESAVSLGGVAGPLLVVGASALITPQGIFAVSVLLLVLTAGLALVTLGRPRRVSEEISDAAREYAARRALVAQATLRGIVTSSRAVRRGDAVT